MVDGISTKLHRGLMRCSHWEMESDTPRIASGVRDRANRLVCLGNAVVPQVAEFVGRRILEADFRQRQQSDAEQRG